MGFRRKKREPEPEPKYRKQGEIAIDISGLDKKSQINIARALAEEDAKYREKINIRSNIKSTEISVMPPKKTVVDMNYPPKDMPLEEIQRFWGEISDEEGAEWAKNARNIKAKRNVKPSPL